MPTTQRPRTIIGRYAVHDEIASGGMATVHLGRLSGGAGFSRLIAIKRLHPQLVRDREFATMFCDEARLCARIHHPNVVQTLDVASLENELLLVMDYVHGASLASLLEEARERKKLVPLRIVAAVMQGALEGLHAAHEARDEHGSALGVVHRDVSPENILVGADGVARILDFGVAKAMGKVHSTGTGQIKGKLAYMSPEQARGLPVTRQSDIFSAGVVLWEALAGRRLFEGNSAVELVLHVLEKRVPPPSSLVAGVPPELDSVVMKALSRDADGRFRTAREMLVALEAVVSCAPARDVGAWVEELAAALLAQRAELVRRVEQGSDPDGALASTMPPAGPFEPQVPRERRESGPANDATFQGVRSTWATPGASTEGVAANVGADARELGPKAPSMTQGLTQRSGEVDRRAKESTDPPGARESSPRSRAGADSDDELDALLVRGPPARRASRGGAGHQIPVRSPARTRRRRPGLKWPLWLTGLGLGLSLVDWAIRDFATSLPFRLAWLAELLVLAGVGWALIGLFQQAISPSSRD